ncbi:TetR family transcriptional regulator [Micromonospora lupini]|uniref:TetR/AcrR family transcriptional regulator n=1 Tax=Micromonospora lupini TaxID=285679 RepID=UPI0033E42DBF
MVSDVIVFANGHVNSQLLVGKVSTMSQSAKARRENRPRDSQATRELLLRAATEEFAEHGLAGARIDRIAERAGANKRLLYVYFGDKERVFDIVLERQINALAQATPLDPTDLASFAVARFEYMYNNRHVARLAAWRAFERARPTEAELRSYREKVDAIAAAQRDGTVHDALPAVDLFAMLLKLSESWLTAPAALKAAAGPEPSSVRLEEHRAAITYAVRSITEPRSTRTEVDC